MKSIKWMMVATVVIAVASAGGSTARADTIYTDQATFLANVAPGYYLETFDSLAPGFQASPIDFAGNGFAYQATASNNFFELQNPGDPADIWLSTNSLNDSITFAFTSGNVTAVGGFFFLTDFPGNVTTGDITATLNDGTTLTVTDALANSFVGFTTSASITSLTISTAAGQFVTVNDLITGTAAGAAVPEPSTFVLAGLGLVGVVAGNRHRRRSSAAA